MALSYTTIMDLPEKYISEISGKEFVLASTQEESFRFTIESLINYIITNMPAVDENLVNKTINSSTNYVHSDAIHTYAIPIQNIVKGTPLKIVNGGSDGVYVDIAYNTSDNIIGVAGQNLTANILGEIIILGILDNFDTSKWNVNDLIYGVNGYLVNVKPTTGNVRFIGYVLSSSTSGKILIESGSEPDSDSKSISYSNSATTLLSTNIQDAIDELFVFVTRKQIITTDRILINDNTAVLPYTSEEDIVAVNVYDSLTDIVMTEYTCELSLDRTQILFDPDDFLDGKYIIVSYLATI